MGLLKKALEWCTGRNSLLVQILPLGFVLALSWGGIGYLRNRAYLHFAGIMLIGCMSGLVLTFVPVTMQENDDKRFNNWGMLAGELLLIAAIVSFIIW